MKHIPNRRIGIIVGSLAWLMITTCHAEVFTALAEMEELLETESALIDNLESYIDAQKDKLNYLQR